MRNLIIKPQSQTPEINFNPNNGQLLISGRVYPTHTIKFFSPLIEWCKKYVPNSADETELICEIEYLEDERMIAVFTQAQDRLQSIALVHQNIYQNNDFESIDLNKYIDRLIESLSFNTEKEIEISQQVDAVELNISRIIPIGLIICELITNSLKHAKSDKQHARINISAKVKDNTLVVAYNDNGILKDRSLNEKKENSIGITLIELFAEQLEAKLLFNYLEAVKGFHCRIEIPIN